MPPCDVLASYINSWGWDFFRSFAPLVLVGLIFLFFVLEDGRWATILYLATLVIVLVICYQNITDDGWRAVIPRWRNDEVLDTRWFMTWSSDVLRDVVVILMVTAPVWKIMRKRRALRRGPGGAGPST